DYLVSELCRDYLASDVPAPGTRRLTVRVVGSLLEHHLVTPVAEFSPVALAAWQAWLCGQEAGGRKRYSRSTVWAYIKAVRRGEVVDLPGAGPVDLDAAGVWVYVPAEGHKTEYKGGVRWLVFGPRARAVLAPWLDRDPAAYCFDPREAIADLWREQRAAWG